jgi:hypothetical protein
MNRPISPIRPGLKPVRSMIPLNIWEIKHILMSLECLQNELKNIEENMDNKEYIEANEVIIGKLRDGLEVME